MHQSDSIVIIPTYNEKENIEKIIRAIFALEKSFHILVIDDGSPDGTAAIVRGLISTEFGSRLNIVERSGKQGLGTAYIAGFKWALEHDYEYIFEMDADFSHDPNKSLCIRSKRSELAYRQSADELLCLEICKIGYRIQCARHHCWI